MIHYRTRSRRCLVRLGAALTVLGALLGCGATLPASEDHPLLNQMPQVTEIPGLSGDFVEIPATGQVTLLDFWATFCKPCLKLMPGYQQLWQEHRADGLMVIGVTVDDNPGLVADLLRRLRISYPNLLDDTEQTMQGRYQISDLPRTFVFDRWGQVRLVTTGANEADLDRVRAGVEALLRDHD